MGIEIKQTEFDEADTARFESRLQDTLRALEHLLTWPGFGSFNSHSPALGAELEMYLVDANGKPRPINQQILADAADPNLTLELNRYNLEYNLTPYALGQSPFAETERQILDRVQKLNEIAAAHQGRVVAIGILPTLDVGDFGPENMTDRQRYHALVRQMEKLRGDNFLIQINGEPPLELEVADLTLEGANTSFQIHYRIAPKDFVDTFNAVQMVTPLVLALAGNSPGIFGHDLWCETRIPLFKQSIDTRIRGRSDWHKPPRVSFGQGWVRQSPLELFQEVVGIYPPLLPICSDENPLEKVSHGEIPALAELRLHQSSVWLWNRPVYDNADGGQLRIEMRALPAGPTAVDMMANAAFMIGLAEYYRHKVQDFLPRLPFRLADYNFHRAAEFGLEADIVWPEGQRLGCHHRPVIDVLRDCIAPACEGLASIGISAAEIEHYMAVIQQRLETRCTGAVWQRKTTAFYRQNHSLQESQRLMLEDYIKHSNGNRPVSEWPLRA